MTHQRKRTIAALIMIRTLTSQHPNILLKEVIYLDMKGVRSGDHYYLMQPTYSFWFIGDMDNIGLTANYYHY
jgi:hypothetical protein